MASTATPLFGTLTLVDDRRDQRDPASHGIDLAMELQIAERAGEITLPRSGSARRGRVARAWSWLTALPFVPHRS